MFNICLTFCLNMFDVFWALLGGVWGMFGVCFGYVLGMCLVCFGGVLDVFRGCVKSLLLNISKHKINIKHQNIKTSKITKI